MAKLILDIRANQAHVDRADRILRDIPGAANKALKAAITTTLQRFRTRLTDMIADTHMGKRSEILALIAVKNKSGEGEYTGVVKVSRRKVPLQDFKGVKVSRRGGVKVQMLKSSPIEEFRHAFRNTLEKGHTGIFVRKHLAPKIVPKQGRYAGRKIKVGPHKGQFMKRQAIRELYGFPVVESFTIDPQLTSRATAELAETFDSILDQKIQWQLDLAMRK